jgi:NAD(P)-dependent dehydrogenase (short-subunit alcohol dehydrogenase family)
MRLVLVDIESEALYAFADEMRALGVQVECQRLDVRDGPAMMRLAERCYAEQGPVHLLFNNAGVAMGGYLWEHTQQDWEWVLGVNTWGVIHGIRAFVPRMIAAAQPAHIVNTASVAGLLSAQMMGVYNLSKHAVVSLSETLFHDLRHAGANIGVTLLCPAFVPTGINASARNRPADLSSPASPTESMQAAQASLAKAVDSGRISAAQVAHMTFEAIRERRFYVITHSRILDSVRLRMEDVLEQRNPTDPFSHRPALKPGSAGV